MRKVVATCCIVGMFVACLILIVATPKKNMFYNIKNYYPQLFEHFQDAQLELIEKEINDVDWKDVDVETLLTKASSYKLIKIYEKSQFVVDIKKYTQTVNIISQIQGLRRAFLANLGPKSILKVQKIENCVRISIPLKKDFFTVNECGVWVNRETRGLCKKIMYDARSIFSIYNKTDSSVKFIVLELDCPDSFK